MEEIDKLLAFQRIMEDIREASIKELDNLDDLSKEERERNMDYYVGKIDGMSVALTEAYKLSVNTVDNLKNWKF